ncbi:sugar phosphate phosphatase [Chlamydia trachomatis]|nr:sugar phosphate phosphatase [Chlamydia trachomatis]
MIFLATLLGFTKDQIIAFGDSSNDVEMIRDVGYGVAMANALDEVKNVAKDIAEDTRDLGVYKKAKELKLIN